MSNKRKEPPKSLLEWLGFRELIDWGVAVPLGGLIGISLLLLVGAAYFGVFYLLYQYFVVGSYGASGGVFGPGTLLVAILSAPFIIWRTSIAHRAYVIQKEGHITDRINKAVEQMGAEKTVKRSEKDSDGKWISLEETQPNLPVRIGAIYSLERIAQDSTANDAGRDHVRVMEILCAYVRENAPVSSAVEDKDFEFSIPDHLLPPREDLTITLQVLGRRSVAQRFIEAGFGKLPNENTVNNSGTYHGYRLNLSKTNLRRIEISDLDFSYANFAHSNFQFSFCNRINFSEGIYKHAKMQMADFGESIFLNASLFMTNWQKANLTTVDFEGADLLGSNLEGSHCSSANFWNSRLSFAQFNGALIYRAKFQNSMIDNVEFKKANLKGSEFCDSDGSNVARELLQEILETFFGDSTTRIPHELKRPSFWPNHASAFAEYENWIEQNSEPKIFRI